MARGERYRLLQIVLEGKILGKKRNKTINYLDLTLTVNSEGIGYKIYSKLTSMDTIIPKESFHQPKHKMAVIESYYHRAMTILKDEEERKKAIQVVKQTARANEYRYQPEEVDRVIRKMSARKGKQNTNVLKNLGAVPYMESNQGLQKTGRKCRNKRQCSNGEKTKRISNDQTEKRDKANQSGVY